MTTTASALPLAEIAAVGPEIATVAVNCFAITLVGLAVGFVLLRVEAGVRFDTISLVHFVTYSLHVLDTLNRAWLLYSLVIRFKGDSHNHGLI